MPESLVPIRTALAQTFLGDSSQVLALGVNPATFDARLLDFLTGLGLLDSTPAATTIDGYDIRDLFAAFHATDPATRRAIIASLKTLLLSDNSSLTRVFQPSSVDLRLGSSDGGYFVLSLASPTDLFDNKVRISKLSPSCFAFSAKFSFLRTNFSTNHPITAAYIEVGRAAEDSLLSAICDCFPVSAGGGELRANFGYISGFSRISEGPEFPLTPINFRVGVQKNVNQTSFPHSVAVEFTPPFYDTIYYPAFDISFSGIIHGITL